MGMDTELRRNTLYANASAIMRIHCESQMRSLFCEQAIVATRTIPTSREYDDETLIEIIRDRLDMLLLICDDYDGVLHGACYDADGDKKTDLKVIRRTEVDNLVALALEQAETCLYALCGIPETLISFVRYVARDSMNDDANVMKERNNDMPLPETDYEMKHGVTIYSIESSDGTRRIERIAPPDGIDGMSDDDRAVRRDDLLVTRYVDELRRDKLEIAMADMVSVDGLDDSELSKARMACFEIISIAIGMTKRYGTLDTKALCDIIDDIIDVACHYFGKY